MENLKNIWLELMTNERNVYENATLYNQNRYDVSEYINDLISPYSGEYLSINKANKVVSQNSKEVFSIENNVLNVLNKTNELSVNWKELNEQFLRYHKSLTVYTLLNSASINNYIAEITGLHNLKNAKIVDVGAGTGFVASTFFDYPETNQYFLLDPNLRLLHDQFVRIYPKTLRNKVAHILCRAEHLPIKNETADLVMSLSSIDHFEDYTKFFHEAFRIVKPGGKILISSHLDGDGTGQKDTSKFKKIFSPTLWERITRYIYYRKAKVGGDDHTYHFEDTVGLRKDLENVGFEIEMDHIFESNFILMGRKR